MDKTIESVQKSINAEMYDLKKVLQQLRVFSDTDFSKMTVEERTMGNMFRSLIDPIEDIVSIVEYYKKPVITEGVLHKGTTGRYVLKDIELTCGYPIEIYSDNEEPLWLQTRIEAMNSAYYAYDYPKIDLEGAKVRIRRNF